MNCKKHVMKLIPSVFRKSGTTLLLSSSTLSVEHSSPTSGCGDVFQWGRETGQGWGKAKWQELHFHPDQSAARKDGNTCIIIPRRLEAVGMKNEILFSLQISSVYTDEWVFLCYVIFFYFSENYFDSSIISSLCECQSSSCSFHLLKPDILGPNGATGSDRWAETRHFLNERPSLCPILV